MSQPRIAIIGAGLIGKKRAHAAPSGSLSVVVDSVPDRARELVAECGGTVVARWEEAVDRPDVDAVIVATTHDALVPCAVGALQAGKHVLLEKPGGRSPQEIARVRLAAEATGRVVRVGYNHRFHPSLQRAKELIEAGAIGPLMYVRARYGHGGRLGYDREWRANPAMSGGGELLDQGVHLIDLARWLTGELEVEYGKIGTFFWDMKVEDNAFLLLRSPDGARTAQLHASWTEWKNLFDFEVFGRTGKIQIVGLGRSYGAEEIRHYAMKPELGPPEVFTQTYAGEDASWQSEYEAFVKAIHGERTTGATVDDAERVLQIVREVYLRNHVPWIQGE